MSQYSEQIEFAKINHAMSTEIGKKTSLSKSGNTIIFTQPVCGRHDLSSRIEMARSQMKAADIEYESISAAQAFGLSEEQWKLMESDRRHLGYQLTKKGRKWFEGVSIPGGFPAKILINDLSRHWEPGSSIVFSGDLQIERGKYGIKATVLPVSADAPDPSVRKEIIRWLGYVEDKVAEGYVYQRGVDECRQLGIDQHPDLVARLDKALNEIAIKKQHSANLRILAKGHQYLDHISTNLSKYWYAKGESVVLECIATLTAAGMTSQVTQMSETLKILKQKYRQQSMAASPATAPAEVPVQEKNHVLRGGSGYGCRGWQEGEVVRNSETAIKAGEPEFLYVMSSSKRYWSEDGLSFGVGDDAGYTYKAECREATMAESSDLRAEIAAQENLRRDLKRLKEIKNAMMDKGERPFDRQPVGGRLFDTQDIYGGGSWFVIEDQQWLWYVQNNGGDGSDWGVNNVRTQGAGAIGWCIPFDPDLACELLGLSERIGNDLDEAHRQHRLACLVSEVGQPDGE